MNKNERRKLERDLAKDKNIPKSQRKKPWEKDKHSLTRDEIKEQEYEMSILCDIIKDQDDR